MNVARFNRRTAVFSKTGGKCWYCGIELLNVWEGMAVDHMMPLSRGGGDEPSNLAPACHRCNIRKKAKTPEEYRVYLMFAEGYWFTDAQLARMRECGIDPAPVIEAGRTAIRFYGDRPDIPE